MSKLVNEKSGFYADIGAGRRVLVSKATGTEAIQPKSFAECRTEFLRMRVHGWSFLHSLVDSEGGTGPSCRCTVDKLPSISRSRAIFRCLTEIGASDTLVFRSHSILCNSGTDVWYRRLRTESNQS